MPATQSQPWVGIASLLFSLIAVGLAPAMLYVIRAEIRTAENYFRESLETHNVSGSAHAAWRHEAVLMPEHNRTLDSIAKLSGEISEIKAAVARIEGYCQARAQMMDK